jgi:hypothetical protein
MAILKARLAVLILLSLLSITGLARETDSWATSPDGIKAILAMPDGDKRRALIDSFALSSAIFGEKCYDLSLNASRIIWESGLDKLTTVEADSYYCQTRFVLVLSYHNEHWTYLGSIPLWIKYAIPSYRPEVLFRGSMPGIVVSGEVVDAGSGILQTNMQIFAIISNELHIVFNEPERMRLAVPYKHQCCPIIYKDVQESTYTFIPISSDARSAGIAEERRITVNGHSLTEKKMYVWDAGLRVFYSTGMAPQLR